MWLRIFQHLLPDATAWRIVVQKTLRSFFEGLTGAPEAARQFADDVHNDLFPESTRELAAWEAQFGITPGSNDDATRRANLAGAWRAQGGQSPRYLQDVMQAAGFDVYLHEWWSSGPPYVARDPRDYTVQPLIGSNQCRPTTGAPAGAPRRCRAKAPLSAHDPWRCNRWLANEVFYLVNLNLTREAPPPVSDDADTWPLWIYWASPDINVHAEVPAERRAEFERLLLKICPAHCWLGVGIDFV